MSEATSGIVLMGDDRIRSIPAVDNGEPLRDLREQFEVDGRKADAAGAYAHLRDGLVERLKQAQEDLTDGIRLLVVEGFRPQAQQRRLFNTYRDGLRAQRPAATETELFLLASRYVSPPEVAPHSSGAAIDLTLQAADGTELDLGTPVNASPEESQGRCYTAADGLTDEARTNRALLTRALTNAGLVNYPTEWWHWSYGDRYWAYATGASHAVYDLIDGHS